MYHMGYDFGGVARTGERLVVVGSGAPGGLARLADDVRTWAGTAPPLE